MNAAELCKTLRNRANLTQQDFAAQLGVTFATVNRWENDRTIPGPAAMRKLDAFAGNLGLAITQDNGDMRLVALSPESADANQEERLSKLRAAELFETGLLDTFEVGTFRGLSQIHSYLFRDIFAFAGQVRTVNIAKGNFRFAPTMYLEAALSAIDAMPEDTYDHIIEKYVEMNVAHPFREGNGRATRIWLDMMLKRNLGMVVDWQLVDREAYLTAMEQSPVRDAGIKQLLRMALTDRIADREIFMKGIDASYAYEGYSEYQAGFLE